MRILAAVCLSLLASPASWAQDAPAPEPGAPTDEPDRANLRARLARILAHLEHTAGRVGDAIDAIDAGGSVADAIDRLGGPTMVRQLAQDWERSTRAESGRPADASRAADAGAPAVPDSRPDPRRVMRFLQEHAPEVAARVAEVRAGSPRRAEVLLARLGPRIAEIVAAQEHDPALAEIMIREFTVGMELLEVGGEIARARREGDRAPLEDLRPRLDDLAAEQVDLRLQRREHEIAALERRVESLREELGQQREARQELIDQVIHRASESWRAGED